MRSGRVARATLLPRAASQRPHLSAEPCIGTGPRAVTLCTVRRRPALRNIFFCWLIPARSNSRAAPQQNIPRSLTTSQYIKALIDIGEKTKRGGTRAYGQATKKRAAAERGKGRSEGVIVVTSAREKAMPSDKDSAPAWAHAVAVWVSPRVPSLSPPTLFFFFFFFLRLPQNVSKKPFSHVRLSLFSDARPPSACDLYVSTQPQNDPRAVVLSPHRTSPPSLSLSATCSLTHASKQQTANHGAHLLPRVDRPTYARC